MRRRRPLQEAAPQQKDDGQNHEFPTNDEVNRRP